MMKRTMVYLLLSVLLCISSATAEEFFPIGAWFPFSQVPAGVNRYNNLTEAEVNTILQQVKDCGFNVVHAPHESNANQTPALNAKLLNAANAKGLKVQLYAWQCPCNSAPWNKGTYWCRTADMTAYNANVQNSLALQQPSGIYRFKEHRFYLKTDDNNTSDVVAVIEVWDGGMLKDSDSITGTRFDSPDTWQGFDLADSVESQKTLTYKVQYTGAANLWVDKVRAYSGYDCAYKLLDGDYDTQFGNNVNSYNSYPAMWRFYLADEPWWDVTNEAIHYMGDFLETQGKSWQACSNYHPYPTWLNKFVEETQPPELLIDPYPLDWGGQGNLQNELNTLATWLQNGENAANLPSPSIPLWVVVQAHSWGTSLRNPTPEEIRVQVNMALAYGAKGIYYFMYAPFPAQSCSALVDGAIPGNRNDKWYEVQDLNSKLASLNGTLLSLNWDTAFLNTQVPGGKFITSVSGNYIHTGLFNVSSSTKYFILVNRVCQEGANEQTPTVTFALNPNTTYQVLDVYTNTRTICRTNSEGATSLTTTLQPGDGKLFEVKPSSIQSAIIAASNGQTVYVGTGTYNEQLSMKSGVDLVGQSSTNTIIDVGTAYTTAVSFNGVNAKLTGFKLRGYSAVYCNNCSPTIEGNAMYNSEYGIYTNNSSPKIKDNSISGCTYGILAYNQSNPQIRQPLAGHNTITGSGQGVRCISNSKPELGLDLTGWYGNNNIETTGYDVYVNSGVGLTVWAKRNWWNGTPSIYTASGDTVYWDPPLSGQAKIVAGLAVGADLAGEEPERQAYSTTSLLLSGGRYGEAVEGFKSVIETYPGSRAAEACLCELIFAYRELEREKEALAYLEEISRRVPDSRVGTASRRVCVPLLSRLGKGAEALALVQELLEGYPGSPYERDLLFQEGMIYQHNLGDKEKAEEVFERFILKYPDDEISDLARLELNAPAVRPIDEVRTAGKTAGGTALSPNHPNPFNAETMVGFTLPQATSVTLVIYDVLGQRVRTLADGEMTSGVHRVRWDGKDQAGQEVSSGLYFCRLEGDDGKLLQIRKMVLIR